MKTQAMHTSRQNNGQSVAQRLGAQRTSCSDASQPESALNALPAELIKVCFSLENARYDLGNGHHGAAEATLTRLIIRLTSLLEHLPPSKKEIQLKDINTTELIGNAL